MASLNKVMIIGYLGNDPEMRYSANGTPQTEFRVAVSHRYTSREGERREETEWFQIVAFNKLAETCSQYLQKGRQAYVEGRLRTRSWEGTDGNKHYRTEVIASTVSFLDRAGRDGDGAEDFRSAPASVSSGDVDPDDLPFE